MASTFSQSRASLPGARIIDFHTAELMRWPDEDRYYLHVEGELPAGDVEAKLAPRFYSDRPDYWAIEVVAVQVPSSETESRPETSAGFACNIPLADHIGLRGITVVGANRVQRFEIEQKMQ